MCYIYRCARQCGGGVFVCFFWFTFIQGPPSVDESDNDPCEATGAHSAVCDMSMCI
jgi:hypothetical protein